MFGWIANYRRRRRALEYLKDYPEDGPAVQAIIATTKIFGPKDAREIAEVTAGRQLSNEEWSKVGER